MSLAGCAERDEPEPEWIIESVALISPTPIYSAYDGVHEYQVTATLARAALELGVDFSSVRWTVDEQFVTVENFAPIPGALLLTMKKAGATAVRGVFTTLDGKEHRMWAPLTISSADAEDWAKGDARYEHGGPLRRESAAASPPCGLSEADLQRLPPRSTSACAACHDPANGLFDASTPHLTAAYDDEELIGIFSKGERPNAPFRTPFMQSVSRPECVFQAVHDQDVAQEEERGLVWKLRSLDLHFGLQD